MIENMTKHKLRLRKKDVPYAKLKSTKEINSRRNEFAKRNTTSAKSLALSNLSRA